MTEHKYTNKLIQEKSPYLLQHAHNPVDWYPWGPEAFSRASGEDKPIFLSIGYSTCHWCHVMERESFEDEEVARILNKNFIAIKVDREERPDIDHIYMSVCQALTGHGGWPLTIFMTPEKTPFFAGTYFPKKDRSGIMGLVSLLEKVSAAWKNNRSELEKSGQRIIEAFGETEEPPQMALSMEMADEAYSHYKAAFDKEYGGIGNAPKFPSPHNLYFLMRYWYKTREKSALAMVETTLDSMRNGGIFDHIGFGFSRYSTDRKWLVPHFEKMLYDNALLAVAYLEAWQVTRKKEYADTAVQIFTYVLRDMISSEGGFYSAEDADSEGVEGKFYIWEKSEIESILGKEDAEAFCRSYDITSKGNFEGKNIPNLIHTEDRQAAETVLNKCRERLFAYREKRVHPYKDDKILTAWNGLMIAALAMGGRILKKGEYTDAAEKAAGFILSRLVRYDGRLLARFRDGEASYPAYLEDYSFLVWGFIELYETTFKAEYLKTAVKLNEDMLKLFSDEKGGGLFLYGTDSEKLILRPKEIYDGATPSGNSAAAYNLIRLARLTGIHELEDRAQSILNAFSSSISAYPAGYSFSLLALMNLLTPSQEIVLAGDNANQDLQKMIEIVRDGFRPFAVTILTSADTGNLKEVASYIADYTVVKGKATAYFCENHTCQAPISEPETFRELLQNF